MNAKKDEIKNKDCFVPRNDILIAFHFVEKVGDFVGGWLIAGRQKTGHNFH